MKNSSKKIKLKKLFIIRTLLILIFVVSLFSSINTLANTNPFKIIDAVIDNKSEGVTGSIDSFTNDEVKDNIKFYKLNDSVTYKITLKNNRDNEIKISSISDDNKNSYLEYVYDNLSNTTIKANEEFEFIFKVVYKNELEDITKRDQINNVNFNINYIEDDRYVNARINLNPNTGDNVYISFIILGASTCCLIISLVINKKNKKKIIRIIIIGVIGLPLFVNALNATFSIKLNSNFGLYDKVIVTYNSAGDSHIVDSNYGEIIDNLEVPDARDGYTFDGWEIDGEEFNPNEVLEDDIILDAKWSLIDYLIRYDLNGGTINNINKESYTIEDEFTLNNPTRDGYKFTGWTGTDLSEKTKSVTIKNKFGEREYIANWEATTYSISYDGLSEEEKNSLGNKTKYTILDTITLKEPTFRYDSDGDKTEKFIGWEDEDGNVSTNVVISNSFGNKTYTAKWEAVSPNTYTITYNLDNGSCSNPTSFTKKTETFKLNNPEKDGYKFTGWSGTDLEGNNNKDVYVNKGTRKNLEFTAHYNPITYSISYDYNGGSGNNTDTYTIEDEVTVTNPTRNYYDFVGWTGTGLNQSTKDLVISEGNFGNRSYKANWKAKSYNIEYVLDNGVVNGNPDTYTVEDTFKLKNPTKPGYEFTGWTGIGITTPSNDFTIPAGTNGKITLTAHYVANQYTISFDVNTTGEYTGSMSNQTFTYDTPQNLNENKFKVEGYTFIGWNTQSDGLGTSYTDKEEVNNLATSGNVKLYAQWSKAQAMFLNGIKASNAMKKLAGNSNVNANSDDKLIKAFKKSDTAPNISDMTEDNIISVSEGEYTTPIYAWFDNGTIYWWSEDENPSLNSSSAYLFGNMQNLASVELEYFDTNNLINMSSMFYNCKSLTSLDLSNFNTSNVTDMNSLFYSCTGLTTLNLGNNFDTSNVTTMYALFSGCSSLNELNLGDKFNTSNVTTMYGMFYNCKNLTTLDLGNNFNTSNVTDMESMFKNCENIKSLNLGDKFDTSKVTKMNNMFYFCKELENLNLGNKFDTSNVTNMSYMFNMSNSAIETLNLGDKFNTSNVTNMSRMFYNFKGVKTINFGNKFDTSKVTDMAYMFSGCSMLESLDLSQFNTSNVTTMSWMFAYCKNMNTLILGNNFDTGKVKDMSLMFKNCEKLEVLNLEGKFDTSNVTNMNSMFTNCEELTSLDLGSKFNTSKVTNMIQMFSSCYKLKTLNLGNNFNTSNVTDMLNMFESCYALESLDLGSKFDTSKVTNMNSMFRSCRNLVSLKLGNNFDTSNVTNMNQMFFGLNEITELNLGTKFNTGKVTNMKNMFNSDKKLVTIYAPTFDISHVTENQGIFIGCNSLVGGSGTTFSATDISYAHVDGGTSNPGYFTKIQ